jgi:hypothetical protein
MQVYTKKAIGYSTNAIPSQSSAGMKGYVESFSTRGLRMWEMNSLRPIRCSCRKSLAGKQVKNVSSKVYFESHLQLGSISVFAVVAVQNEIQTSREFPRCTGGCKPGFKGDHQAHNKSADEHMNTLFKDQLNNLIDC